VLVRKGNHHVPIKSSRSEDCGIDHVGMIASAHYDYTFPPESYANDGVRTDPRSFRSKRLPLSG
jgi:hypothetical protein